jgi:hypothetical protein
MYFKILRKFIWIIFVSLTQILNELYLNFNSDKRICYYILTFKEKYI